MWGGGAWIAFVSVYTQPMPVAHCITLEFSSFIFKGYGDYINTVKKYFKEVHGTVGGTDVSDANICSIHKRSVFFSTKFTHV